MNHLEYLLSYGLRGEFGRFRALRPLRCQRGDRAVVRSHRGLEIAEVLREAAPNHAQFLPNTSVGQLIRLVSSEDERTEAELRRRGDELLQRGNAFAEEMVLPLELLDVEMLLDREHALVHHLRWNECDVRPLVSTLSREFAVHVTLTDLTRVEEEAVHSCGEEGCGGGNCGSCGTGGGCGTCGTAHPVDDRRTPLL